MLIIVVLGDLVMVYYYRIVTIKYHCDRVVSTMATKGHSRTVETERQTNVEANADGTQPAQIDKRTVRAIKEHILIMGDPTNESEQPLTVYGEGGSEYLVDTILGSCTCPDYQNREPERGCKHIRRVRIEAGEFDMEQVQGQLEAMVEKLAAQVESLNETMDSIQSLQNEMEQFAEIYE